MDFRVSGDRVSVNVPTWPALQARVSERLATGQGFALATLNLDHIVKLRGSPAFRRVYARMDLVTADGNPIVWMSRLAGRRVELIPGADAILMLARIAARQGVTVALVGSTDDTLAGAKAYLEGEVRDLHIVETIAPAMGFDPAGADASRIFARLDASGARLCFVALGAPKQEIFAAAGRVQVPGLGFACIGAGLDFFAGTQRRAPDWARRFALEWLWRMIGSPRRLGMRYLRCLVILPGQMLRAMVLRFRSPQH
ncbi:WecB/TagA/CpsF family glycosyltransferase [Salipiger thiooxidans]|uniref:WecB/TagA/CpsF family glycosyltransferase n=1 Tax=Salipiger thiooxidans TaxID=282683 RepID=UPI001A8FC62B|nr:WecB/TagA/CpsF family glycosyltransferase [Salipiger thiooxidans]MBN8187900.1 WecB/TagA/CpsF family glycosyltransferase [Salipiger thiooxidans]